MTPTTDSSQPQAPRRVVEWAQAAQVPPSATGVITIDLAQIRANWRTLAKRVAPAGCGAVVKADAYGLGAARVIPALYEAGCRSFFVATPGGGEGGHRARARRHDLCARRHPARMRARARRRSALRPVLASLEEARALGGAGARAARARRRPRCTSTPGSTASAWARRTSPALLADAELMRRLDIALIISHLACADDAARTR